MLKIGQTNRLTIQDKLTNGAQLVSEQGKTVFLPAKFVTDAMQQGDAISVFIYLDTDDQPIATTEKPLVQVGDCAFLTVVDVNKMGAFLDWGLPKDLLLPFGEQKRRLQPGHKQCVYVYIDKASKRITASSRLNKFLPEINSPFKGGEQVELFFWGKSDLGFKAVINNQYLGLLHQEDAYETVRVGERRKGFVKSISPEGKINLALHLPNKEQLGDLAEQVYADLKTQGGKSTLTDKSSPEAIKAKWHVSKGSYKKALGKLYKQRKIVITDDMIKLVE
ncbi:CvfB family protein [Marinicella gelatinilytica]|uniref:CvfB family protein n=1 Tax=Marinicella gelatinilytica TaxID=2996017 RepID=UPI0022608399|nr:S1-like domain-containing RNA-binding protein [Marinicella gelatinilytica]MCX7544861.1 S1-like domain-containing RNA-binding protein [Marinicella gelatinilytica]